MSAVRLKLSTEGDCLDALSVSAIRARRTAHVRMAHTDHAGTVTQRKFFPCEIGGVAYQADVVTGSLYVTETGRCLTSDAMHLGDGVPVPTKPAARRPANKARKGSVWERTEKAAA
jgi:hypothetical protein